MNRVPFHHAVMPFALRQQERKAVFVPRASTTATKEYA